MASVGPDLGAEKVTPWRQGGSWQADMASSSGLSSPSAEMRSAPLDQSRQAI